MSTIRMRIRNQRHLCTAMNKLQFMVLWYDERHCWCFDFRWSDARRLNNHLSVASVPYNEKSVKKAKTNRKPNINLSIDWNAPQAAQHIVISKIDSIKVSSVDISVAWSEQKIPSHQFVARNWCDSVDEQKTRETTVSFESNEWRNICH